MDLVVHGALIVCVRVCACMCVCVRMCACVCACVCVWYQTPFSSCHECGPSLFLSTGKHLAVGRLRHDFSLLCLDRAATAQSYHPTNFRFFSSLVIIRRMPSEACSRLGKRRIDRSTSKRSSLKVGRAGAITAFCVDRSLYTPPWSLCIVTGN